MWRIRREDTIAERMDEKRAEQGTWFQALALRYQSLASSLGARTSKPEDRAYTAHAQVKAASVIALATCHLMCECVLLSLLFCPVLSLHQGVNRSPHTFRIAQQRRAKIQRAWHQPGNAGDDGPEREHPEQSTTRESTENTHRYEHEHEQEHIHGTEQEREYEQRSNAHQSRADMRCITASPGAF